MSNLDPRQRRLLEEYARREMRKNKIDYKSLLFGPQRDFVLDPSKFKAAVCSRRAGKTFGDVIYMLSTANEIPYCQIPFITITRAMGKRNIWLDLQQLDSTLELGGRFNGNELTYTMPNGSVIFIIGADDESEIHKLRGSKFPLAIIDEAQNFRPLIRPLIRDVLEPAVADYDGTIAMTGTPGVACAGFYYDVTTDKVPEAKKWSIHHWTVVDNPHHPYDAERVEQVRLQNGWLPDNPSFVREWKGLWVADDSKLVYKLSTKNYSYDIPDRPLEYVLGIDLGYEDSTAFVVLGFDDKIGQTWVIESWSEQHLIPSAVAARVDRLREKYDFSYIVADSGGFGKGYVEEMKQRYSIPIEAAEKTRKLGYIELLNGDLQAGAIHFYKHKNQELLDEMGQLPWKENDDGTPDRTTIDDRFSDHLCDALLYGWRACRQYFYDPEFEGIKPHSDAWWAEKEDAMEREVERQVLGSREPQDDLEAESLVDDSDFWSLSDVTRDIWLQ